MNLLQEKALYEKSLTYKEKILKFLQDSPNQWFYAYELTQKNTRYGWLGSSADRIAREMAREGLIERDGRDNNKFYARYRFVRDTLF